MGTTHKSFAKRLPTFTLIVTLVTGLVIGLVLSLQLHFLATEQLNHLGKTLSTQLAKIVRDPIIHQDTLSLQVEVDEMLPIDGVQRASVYDASNHLLVQAQRAHLPEREPSRHTSPITMEDTIAGYVTIDLDKYYLSTSSRELLQSFVFFWLALTSVLVLLSIQLGRKFSTRLKHITQQLPGDESAELDELSLLEQRIEPLLATRQQFTRKHSICHSSLLGIACQNLSRLESLLNQEHFDALMTRLDQLVDDATELYGATRLNGTRYSIYLEFSSEDDQGDHRIRAIYCATALFKLAQQLLATQGVTVELVGTITSCLQPLSSSTLINERSHEKRIESLVTILDKAVTGEILLDQDTGSHPSLVDVSLSPLAEDSPLYRVNGLNDSGEKLVSQQLALLTRNR
tara:strand:+ start:13080 stop:14285 length:1206 start_codon:yes stop_codon:yes gene_type:complete